MKRFLVVLTALVGLALAVPGARADQMTAGDSTSTSGITFMIYPCFTLGGGHMHTSVIANDPNNNLQRASKGGFVYSEGAVAYVNVYCGDINSASVRDTTRVRIPSGAGFTRIPECDSLRVILTNATVFSWGLFR